MRRWLTVLVTAAVVAAACTTSTDARPPTDGRASESPGTGATASGEAGRGPEWSEPVPVDAETTIGRLDNGLTYYARSNDSPGGRLQLRLAVDAGSALEDADQLGAAHFLEHMLFNGTERFPENELVAVLESFGAAFGPDVNAYTSYDETVYQLAVSTADPNAVELAFDVLVEWADRARIEPAAVAAERGVVTEEWRLRDQGTAGRTFDEIESLYLRDSAYEDRQPIGTLESISTMGAEPLRRFYEDWYRPDLMAVVAVGDLPVDELVELIVDRFGQLGSPESPRPRPELESPPAVRGVAVLADPDAVTASVDIGYASAIPRQGSVGAFREQLLADVGFAMLDTRLRDDIRRGTAPYSDAYANTGGYVRVQRAPSAGAFSPANETAAVVRALATEYERVRRFGFGDVELQRTLGVFRSEAEQRAAGAETRQDRELADAYVANFLRGSPIPAASDELELTRRVLDEMTAADVSVAFRELLDAGAPAVLIVVPAGSHDEVPDELAVAAILDAVAGGDIEARPALDALDTELLASPGPAEVLDRSDTSIAGWQGETVRLENGVRVSLVETSISENLALLWASSPGGLSALDPVEVPIGRLVGEVAGGSGIGRFDAVALDQLLASTTVDLVPYLTDTEEGFRGRAATEDLETLLQLVHLYFTEPRISGAALETQVRALRPIVENPSSVPATAVEIALADARWGDEPVYRVLPTASELATMSAADALAVFRDRFADPADFDFAIVGDIDIEAAIELVRRYLGSLRSEGRFESVVDRQPAPPDRVVERTVRAGVDQQGSLTVRFSERIDHSPTTDVLAGVLQIVLTQRLTERLREALAATYSPVVVVSPDDEPDPVVDVLVRVSGDPARLDEIARELRGELDEVATRGPRPAELASAKEQLRQSYELFSNEQLLDRLLFHARRPHRDLTEIAARATVLDGIDAEDVATYAARVTPADRFVSVRLVPER